MIGDKERFYPLGTAVRLKDNSDIFVIIGLLPQLSEGVVADYLAVRYPCGYQAAPESQFAFNAESVVEVVADGYRTESFHKLEGNLAQLEQLARAPAKSAIQNKKVILE